MNAKKCRCTCVDLVRQLPDVRPIQINRGRYLVSAGMHNDEHTLRRVAELLLGLLPERRHRVST